MAFFEEAGALGHRRAGDYNDSVEMSLGIGFVKQRNIRSEPTVGAGCTLGQADPASPDGGMQNLFQRMPFRRVRKYDFSQSGPDWLALFIQNLRTKSGRDGVLDRCVLGKQFVRALIGVEKFHGQILA